MSDPRTLYDSPEVHCALEGNGRLRIRRGGAAGATVCNVSAERVVDAAARAAEGDSSEAWLALRGPLARVDFARHEGECGLVGPFRAEATEHLAAALRVELALPRTPVRVDVAALRDEPERWHERFVEAEGEWIAGRDASDFAGAWLYPPPGVSPHEGARRVRVVGFFRCTGARDFDDRRNGHGPFGLAAAELDALEVAPL